MAFDPGANEVKRDINVTPLVDVCLVLLIIFMVVTPMLQQGIDVLLPTGAHSREKQSSQVDLIISIRQDGTVFVDQDWIPDAKLAAYLKAEHEKDAQRAVMLKADRRLKFGKVREVMKAANDAQFSQVAILTEK